MKKLLDKYTDKEILKRLIEIYPDQNKKGYAHTLSVLRKLKPEYNDWKIYPSKYRTDGEHPTDKTIRYAIELNKYLCSFVDCSKFGYVVGKYFEIPLSGALLLAEYTSDLDNLGFKNGENYISVDKDNFFEILDYIISRSEKYRDIRMNGRQLILDNHTNINRFEQFREIISQWN